jgi:hypothetical protein
MIYKIVAIKRGWIVRIHRIAEQDIDFYLPVFVFTFTKMKMKMKEPVRLTDDTLFFFKCLQ